MFGREAVMEATPKGIEAMRRMKLEGLKGLRKADKLGLAQLVGIGMWG